MIDFRYLIALIVFVVLVLFQINGSSIGIWDKIVSDSPKTVIAGNARAIRSDEWEVLTPKVMSQSGSDVEYALINQNIGISGENMLISLGMPVRDIYTISKPLNWGYLFLGNSYGLSWYWNMKWLLILLLSFELCMIVTRKNRLVSFLGAFWLMLSPAVQWWFAQHVGDVVLYMEAIVVTFYYFFQSQNHIWRKAGFALLFGLSCLGYICPLYPPLQIPLGYFAIMLMIIILVDKRHEIHIRKSDILIMGGTFVFVVLMLGHLYLMSKDAIYALANTVYPGKRTLNGGGSPNYLFFSYLTNLYLPFKDIAVTNNCEMSSFFNFLPGVVLALPVLIRRKTGNLKFGIPIAIFSLFFVYYMYFQIPTFLAKITLLSYVTGTRASLVYAFTGAILSIWALAEISKTKGLPRVYSAGVSVALGLMYVAAVKITALYQYQILRFYLIVIVLLVVLNYLLMRGRKKLFTVIMLCMVFVAGATVNPVNIGTGAFFNNDLSREIQTIDRKDNSAVWISANRGDNIAAIGAFIYANGADCLGGVNAIPDNAKWRVLDPDGKYTDVYNRSAHITFDIQTSPTTFELTFADSFTVHICVDDLKKLKIDYIVSNKDLTQFNKKGDVFTKIFTSVDSEYNIYHVTYQ